ncbi:uncharacterized protein KIAA1143 homolog [Leucoraja erinacea]|uniref:uncharacterized protein KIAA1143 homolog n=1 Tax=Leucoraja erinaceus TaxID=7782 RepID=UPI00245621F1|nr:uncharacterized protein KIAA1143 homolog [Leucoraja erinacea]
MSKRSAVSFVRPPEPAFLRRFKEAVGYTPGPSVHTKRQLQAPVDSDSGPSDGEDEQPQVVVLRQGDLTAEEATKIKETAESSEKSQPVDGKIVFRKPVKRSSDDKVTGVFSTSSKKKKEEQSNRPDATALENKAKQVKNSSLLSFGDDEEDDE